MCSSVRASMETLVIKEHFRILAWHDMLKNFAQNEITKMGLDTLVQPVIWDYSESLATVERMQAPKMKT
ncbi:unnamed protein product [Cylicostephanus goldi]|uniref:Uncharacterized protein n=1 Tax=Cylicostephanus goldi TaxID=71465 RepID=A0A3P7MV63_CYLGO|nr:unnamed protein product [Cylicostephanus goldi]